MPLYSLNGKSPKGPQTGDVFIAPTACVIGDVIFDEGVSVWFNTTIRGDNDPIRIGKNSNIQDGSTLHTDIGIPLTVGEGVTVGHNVVIHGCTLGDNCLIGIGSVILNRAVIGKNSIVGAGSLIPEGKVYPDGVLILGSPARVVRSLTPDQIEAIKKSAEYYVKNGRRYTESMVESQLLEPCAF